jgi:prevent-host-death family protein
MSAMKTKEKVVTATEFKAKCLKMLDRLNPQGIVVTKRGRAVARVVPIRGASKGEYYGAMKGRIQVKGDLFSTGIKWHAQS